MNKILWIIIILLILGGGYYWWSTQQNAMPSPDNGQNPSTAMGTNGSPDQGNLGQPDNGQVQQPSGTLMSATNAAVGPYLVASNGMAVYTYDKDTAGKSNCTGQCATNWPPYTVSDASLLNASGLAGELASITRADGSIQVTYKNMPLYFYAQDKTTADVTGDNVGGVWHVVKQ